MPLCVGQYHVGGQRRFQHTCTDILCIYKHNLIHIYIYMVNPPPGAIGALGVGIIILDNYVINMITCSKTLQIPVKNASCMHMTLNILKFQKETNSNFLKPESGSEKGPINLQIVNPLHEKRT